MSSDSGLLICILQIIDSGPRIFKMGDVLAVILVILGLIGVIGNTIAISILNRRDMESPNNFILKGWYMEPYIITIYICTFLF